VYSAYLSVLDVVGSSVVPDAVNGFVTIQNPANSSLVNNMAFSVNSSGSIAGTSWSGSANNTLDFANTTKAFTSNITSIQSGNIAQSSVVGTQNSSQGFGINAAGTVVGQIDASGTQHAFSASSGSYNQPTDLGTGGNTSYAQAINDSGQVVGQSNNQAAVWTNNSPAGGVELGANGVNSWSMAKGLNDSNDIVGYGYVNADGKETALLWDGSTVNGAPAWNQRSIGLGLNEDESYAFSINADGLVVGEYGSGSNDASAFIYDANTSQGYDLFSLLSSSGKDIFSSLITAAFIDELNIPVIVNAIVGDGMVNGVRHAFIAWDPSSEPAGTPTPEPGTMLLFGLGAAGAAFMRRRKVRSVS